MIALTARAAWQAEQHVVLTRSQVIAGRVDLGGGHSLPWMRHLYTWHCAGCAARSAADETWPSEAQALAAGRDHQPVGGAA